MVGFGWRGRLGGGSEGREWGCLRGGWEKRIVRVSLKGVFKMASIGREPGGQRRILFVAPDGKRKTIRLGKVSQKVAEAVKVKVEALVAVAITSQPLDSETAAWVAGLDGVVYDQLVAAGLTVAKERRAAETLTLAEFIDQYIEARRKSLKPGTLTNHYHTHCALVEFFGADRVMGDITAGSCDDWRVHLESRGYAPATIGRHVKRGRQFFRAAVRKKLISENPMQDVRAAAQVNKSREYFVTREAVEKIIAACPNTEWRLIVALARYGGVRTPSETYALTWGDVDWERGRIRVPSPKTAGYEGREARMMPLFPELRPYLEAAFDEAEPGATYVIAKHRIGSKSLGSSLERIMNRAGVERWPRLFQNMRASRETELVQDHPLHVVTAWIGNSARIAAQHYLQVTDADFDRANQRGTESGTVAARNPAQQPAAPFSKPSQQMLEVAGNQGVMRSGANPCGTIQRCRIIPLGYMFSRPFSRVAAMRQPLSLPYTIPSG